MAKVNKKTKNEKTKDVVDEKSPGFFQKLFAWVIIPLLFVIAILLVIAQFTNTNVFEKATEVLPNNNEEEAAESSEEMEKKIVELKAEIQEKDAQIEKLQKELDDALAENENQKAIQEQLQQRIQELESGQEEAKKDLKEIVNTYEKMSAKAVAPIIVQMSDDKALEILSNMKPETLSAVLAKMDPKDAARYTELLSAKNNNKSDS
mgnify:CR=1 FL=1